MAKQKVPYSYPRRLLTPKEYERYKEARTTPARIKLIRNIEIAEKQNPIFERQEAYRKSRTGRFGSALAGGIKTIGTRGGTTRFLYRQQITPVNPFSKAPKQKRTIQGNTTGRRGRPQKSYDQRYAQYGGVYGYRKYLANQYRMQRMEALRRATITPQQQVVMQQIESRERQRQMSPEGRVIPDTSGNVDMNSIFDEINRASNVFG